ncbi:uncharacterized protein LOC134693857 [Mytilus trossulus]|uniref:uncharacterized protein LOC134693857 n=1 Tax=Mytilus trossulus TaxID=6551 RepID=UPI0030066467
MGNIYVSALMCIVITTSAKMVPRVVIQSTATSVCVVVGIMGNSVKRGTVITTRVIMVPRVVMKSIGTPVYVLMGIMGNTVEGISDIELKSNNTVQSVLVFTLNLCDLKNKKSDCFLKIQVKDIELIFININIFLILNLP